MASESQQPEKRARCARGPTGVGLPGTVQFMPEALVPLFLAVLVIIAKTQKQDVLHLGHDG